MLHYTKIKQAKEPQLYFSLLKFIKFHTLENIFMLITRGGLAFYSVSKHVNEITKVCKIIWFLRNKTNKKKWRVVVLRIWRHFLGCFEKHSMGKHKKNLRTVYNLFNHWNMALSTDFRHLKTLLAARSVFHLFWRWQPVAHAPFQQPRNAAVLKRSRPRTSDTDIWASLIVAGPYFLSLLPRACHLVSLCVAQQLETTLWICLVALQ